MKHTYFPVDPAIAAFLIGKTVVEVVHVDLACDEGYQIKFDDGSVLRIGFNENEGAFEILTAEELAIT